MKNLEKCLKNLEKFDPSYEKTAVKVNGNSANKCAKIVKKNLKYDNLRKIIKKL